MNHIQDYLGRLSLRYQGRTKKFGLLVTLLVILATGGMLGLLIYREREVLLNYEWQIFWLPILVAVILYTTTVSIAAWTWGNIVNSLGKSLPFIRHHQYYCISNAAKRIPGTLWYVASRVTLYQQEGMDYKHISMASVVEYAMVTVGGILVGIPFSLSILARYSIHPALALILLALSLSVVHPKVFAVLLRILRVDLKQYRLIDLLSWAVRYGIIWLLGGILLFAVINIIYPLERTRLPYVIGVWVVVIMVTRSLLLSPTNLGVTEIGLSLLLATIMPAPIAVVVSVLMRLVTTLLDLIYAGIWMLITSKAVLTQKN